MKQIKNFDLSRLRTEECFGFLQQVNSAAGQLLTAETDKTMVEAFSAAVNAYDTALKQSEKNSKTSGMTAADEEADAAWRTARAYAKAIASHPDKTLATIGQKLYDLFAKFGDLAGLGYHEEYARYYNLLQELTAVSADERQSAAFDAWLENMNGCYAHFIELRDEKVNEDVTYQTGVVKECRTAAEEAYKVFVQRVNALCIVMGEDSYGSFIKLINVIIDSLNSTLAARSTKAANAAKAKENETAE